MLDPWLSVCLLPTLLPSLPSFSFSSLPLSSSLLPYITPTMKVPVSYGLTVGEDKGRDEGRIGREKGVPDSLANTRPEWASVTY
jgi:hypothetical protein